MRAMMRVLLAWVAATVVLWMASSTIGSSAITMEPEDPSDGERSQCALGGDSSSTNLHHTSSRLVAWQPGRSLILAQRALREEKPRLTTEPEQSPAPGQPFNRLPAMKDTATTVDKATNYQGVMEFLGIRLSPAQLKFLNEHKFLLIPKDRTVLKDKYIIPTMRNWPDTWEPDDFDEMLAMFDFLKGKPGHVFQRMHNARLVNPDVVLHAFFKYCENSFLFLQKNEMAPVLRDFVQEMRGIAREYRDKAWGQLREHYEHLTAQFTVPLILLKNADWEREAEEEESSQTYGWAEAKSMLKDDDSGCAPETLKRVEDELRLIYEAKGIGISPLFETYVDYSAYKPRGPYENDSVLQAYFRARHYLGVNGYPLDSEQGLTAALLVGHLMESARSNGSKPLEKWRRFVEINSLFVGRPDDISYSELLDFLKKTVALEDFSPKRALEPAVLQVLSQRIKDKELIKPLTGYERSSPGQVIGEKEERHSEPVPVFRVLGTSFMIDSWAINRVAAALANRRPPVPLTVSALVVPIMGGDPEASRSLDLYLETHKPVLRADQVSACFESIQLMAREAEKLPSAVWTSSLNALWLQTLTTLKGSYGAGYPLYMRSELFPVKQLESFLGSYTERRHAMLAEPQPGGAEYWRPKSPPPPRGFVEPNMPFWYSMRRLVDWLIVEFEKHGLMKEDMEVDEEEGGRLRRFQRDVDFFTQIAEKELADVKIPSTDYQELRDKNLCYMARPFGRESMPLFKEHEKKARSAVIVDIHTDPANKRIVYEATGAPYIMLALVGNENYPRLTLGVAFNHYEWIRPWEERLTDSGWRSITYGDTEADKMKAPKKNVWYERLMVE